MRIKNKYSGVIVPMVTPFDELLNIDIESTEKILENFLEAGVSPFLLGTTGESVSISESQRSIFVKTVIDYVNKEELVYAGISGNCLSESVSGAKKYADFGVDAVVAHLPFYYPLSDNQMLKYYEELADKVPCPVVLYNNPITTNYSVPLEVIEKLSYHENIVGLKDSERGLERLNEAIELWKNRTDFVHLVGWAAQSAYALLRGSDGIVPSTGNIIPKIYQELYSCSIQGNQIEAQKLQEITNRISEIYQKDKDLSQSLPALKVMMTVVGLCKSYVLPPLYSLDEKEQKKIIDETRLELKDEVLITK